MTVGTIVQTPDGLAKVAGSTQWSVYVDLLRNDGPLRVGERRPGASRWYLKRDVSKYEAPSE